MKGLLIKDIRLMTRQKTTLVMVAGIIALFPALDMDPGFIVTYAMILLLFMTVSTVSYDDFDNGMAFLFTLPVDKKTYVREKYVLGLSAAVLGWLAAVLVNVAYFVFLPTEAGASKGEFFLSSAIIFPIALLVWQVLLPLQLKFGAEKARVVIFILAGVIAAITAIGTKIAAQNEEQANIILNRMIETVIGMSPVLLAIIVFAVSIIGLLISYACSVRIMEKKEY